MHTGSHWLMTRAATGHAPGGMLYPSHGGFIYTTGYRKHCDNPISNLKVGCSVVLIRCSLRLAVLRSVKSDSELHLAM